MFVLSALLGLFGVMQSGKPVTRLAYKQPNVIKIEAAYAPSATGGSIASKSVEKQVFHSKQKKVAQIKPVVRHDKSPCHAVLHTPTSPA